MKLPEGLALISRTTSSEVVYVGIAVGAGTRSEAESESGMAHFLEHMSFKGTARRSAGSIFRRMESVGGELNAYTGKEETVYYCACEKRYLDRAVELLLDIVFHSTYPDKEIEKEVEVVLDEIESYNDSPSDLIYDDFEALLFQDNPLGRNILGKPERLREYRSGDFAAFAQRHYRPENAVLFIMGGKDDMLTGVDAARGITGRETRPAHSPLPLFEAAGRTITMKKDTHQAHVMMGRIAYGARDSRYIALFLLNNILGGPAMSSRLNIALRERRGLVYTIQSTLSGYTDTGVWGIYFGCDHSDVKRCITLVRKELQRIVEKPLTQKELDSARRQLKGQIMLSHENSEDVAIAMGKGILHYGHYRSPQEVARLLDSLTTAEVHEVAREIFDTQSIMTLIYE